jgi:hypothetical protein
VKSVDDTLTSTYLARPRVLIDPSATTDPNPPLYTSAPAGADGSLAGVYYRGLFGDGTQWLPVGPDIPSGTVQQLDHTTSATEHFLPFTVQGTRRLWAYRGPYGALGSLTLHDLTPNLPLKALTNTAQDARVNADRSPLRTEVVYYTTGFSRPSQALIRHRGAGTDGGVAWYDVTGNMPTNMDFYRLIANPQSLQELFLATSDGVYRSENGGGCWTRWSYGLRKSEVVLDMVINPAQDLQPVTLYVATQGRGFWGRVLGAPPSGCDGNPASDIEGTPSPLPDTGGLIWGTMGSRELIAD